MDEPASFFESDSVSLWGLLGFDLLWVWEPIDNNMDIYYRLAVLFEIYSHNDVLSP